MWRREKPEFWGTKKAYSPIRILYTLVDDFTPGEELFFPIHNRYDHSNLNEIEGKITYQGETKGFCLPNVAPHEKGLLRVPSFNWQAREKALIEFFDSKGDLIDAETIQLGSVEICSRSASMQNAEIKVIDDGNYVTFQGNDFLVPFSKATGLIEKATVNGNTVIEKGPFLNLDLNVSHKTGPEVREKAKNYIVQDSDWQKKLFSYKKEGENITVALSGKYREIDITVKILITPQGELNIDYYADNAPNGWLRESGLKFYLPEDYETLKWNRKGYWSFYPQNSFAGNSGEAALYNSHKVAYGKNPEQPWNLDTHNYYYFSDAGAVCSKPLTNQAKGMKENCYNYTLLKEKSKIEVYSLGANIGCRINKTPDNRLILYINNRWDYPEIAWGDYCKALEVLPVYGNVKIHL